MELTLHLPDTNISERELREFIAIKLFQEKFVSLGKAAELAEYSERTFADILLRKGVPAIEFDGLDPQEELANA
jgi:predicted HTH domain antitoxin